MMCHTWVRRVSTSLSPCVNGWAGAKLNWVAAKLGWFTAKLGWVAAKLGWIDAKLGWLAANLGWSGSVAYTLHRLFPAKGTLIPN
jgi:hypothetical protein